MWNFGELKTKVGELTQRSGDNDYLSKIGVWLQMSHKTLTEMCDYWIELQEIFNFTTVANQEAYALPNNFDKPFRLYDLTHKKAIHPQTEEEYFDGNIANIVNATTSSVIDKYRLYGIRGTTIAISTSGDTVKVKSSSASDTSNIIIRVEGYIDSDNLIMDYENITITSATPTTYNSGTKTFYKITHISKSANTTGYITIANSSGIVLEYLAPIERVARHLVLRFGLIPAGAYSMRMLYKKTIPEMVNDYDYPFTECDRYLIMDAAGWAFKQDKEDQRAELVWERAADALRALLNNQNSKLGPDYIQKIVSLWASSHGKVI